MDTLGTPATTIMLKGISGHNIHEHFEVGDRRAIITYSADFVASNSIALAVNGVSITPVVYATSHAVTFAALIAAVEALSSCSCTGDATARTLTIIPTDQDIDPVVTSQVTLGASQATATVQTAINDLFEGCPVVLTSTGEVIRFNSTHTANLQVIGYAIHNKVAGELVTVALKARAVVNALSADAIVPGAVAYSSYDTTAERMKFTDGSVTVTNMMGWALDVADSADDAIRVALL